MQKLKKSTKIPKNEKLPWLWPYLSWIKNLTLDLIFFVNFVTDPSLINPKFLAQLLSKTYPKSTNRTRTGHHVRLDVSHFVQKWPFLEYFGKKCLFKKSNNSANFLSDENVLSLHRSPKFIAELFEIQWYKSIKNGAK